MVAALSAKIASAAAAAGSARSRSIRIILKAKVRAITTSPPRRPRRHNRQQLTDL
jgi:hypothetical protein